MPFISLLVFMKKSLVLWKSGHRAFNVHKDLAHSWCVLCTWRQDRHWWLCRSVDVEEQKNSPLPCCRPGLNQSPWLQSSWLWIRPISYSWMLTIVKTTVTDFTQRTKTLLSISTCANFIFFLTLYVFGSSKSMFQVSSICVFCVSKLCKFKEWVNDWWWDWQNRTHLGKCTHSPDKDSFLLRPLCFIVPCLHFPR